ncbi:hypothetical protein AN639_02305 [Candidatus Epulonipiscium fishelsonii]|uniref:Uncharacterized protein n=1 Tax=Candidatus Epulonipiscium fishelsonii TaxID=77094 RepID=A0ACC8XH19_9FIRM|nr:hypothetical protein AN639_02305 [Epulopiscium sp. SCG-B05WGA-EpuloA1]ONI43004.1 hypothetical protein AN396_00140 [Epulopiscium sp. SCG-B11WGA-EpuloA1]ONI47873.1 hypothetical protein AN644_03555 [Epulopiscium sp. SCG-C06WGA-EpuloA1]
MNIKYKLYPYPVLWNANDDYVSSSFSCNMNIENQKKQVIVNVEFNLNNSSLEKLIQNGKAEYVVHIESSSCFYRTSKSTSDTKMQITLEDSNLLSKIELSSFIVAKTDIVNYSDRNFNADYAWTSFKIEKGSILAIGEQYSANIEKELESFSKIESIFTIYRKNVDDNMTMGIDLDNNKICIELNIKDYDHYVNRASTCPNILNSILIFPTLIYAFERLKESFDDYTDYSWLKSMQNAFKKYNLKLDQNTVNEYTSIELAQKIMQFPVSKALTDLNFIGEEE